MSVSIKRIHAKGGTQEKLKALFEKPEADLPESVRNLLLSQRNRMNNGASRCMEMAPYWRGIDRVYEAPYESCSYSIVRDMLSADKSQEDILNAVKSLGLSSKPFMTEVIGPDGNAAKDPVTGKTAYKLDFPTLIDVVLPIASYYTSIREAKLVSDLIGQQPLYKYAPAAVSEKARVQCELVTGVIEQQNGLMGYRATERDGIGPMLRYSEAIQFPLESYYKETVEGDDGKPNVVREGIRWHTPHPTRTFCDRADPLFRVNTDTGVRWGGYWTIVRYADVAANTAYWNKDRVQISSKHWYTGKAWDVYREYYPCTLKRPPSLGSDAGLREEKAFTYTSDLADSGVPLVVFFDRINPKQLGMYDYDGDVWHRFIWCGDTIISCEPWAYCPMVAYLYNYDSRRDRNAGLGLELIPFQDQMRNILTQYLLTMRSALAQVTFYDEHAVDAKQIVELKNLGEKRFRTHQFVPFKPQQLGDQGTNVERLFYSPVLPKADPSVVLQGLRTCIEIMERMLGFTAQEVGAVASHEQTAYEVNISDSHASNRSRMTMESVYDAISAKKQALYCAMIQYGSDEITASVAKLNDVSEKALTDMGYKVEKDPSTDVAGITGPKTPLTSLRFSNTADGERRIADQKIALAMINIFQMVLSNETLIAQVGPKQVLGRFNEILNWAGVPGSWRFNPAAAEGPNGQQIAQQQAAAIQGAMQQEIGKFSAVLGEKVIKPLQEKAQQTDQMMQAIGQALTEIKTDAETREQQAQQVIEQIILNQKKIEQVVGATAKAIVNPPAPQVGFVPAPPENPTTVDPMTGAPIA